MELATKDNKEFEHLCVYVAQDCAGITYLIIEMCNVELEVCSSAEINYFFVSS